MESPATELAREVAVSAIEEDTLGNTPRTVSETGVSRDKGDGPATRAIASPFDVDPVEDSVDPAERGLGALAYFRGFLDQLAVTATMASAND
jgi:hypothetical protein